MGPDFKKTIVFTAPSGAGKTTLVRHLLEKYDFLDFSISACTREKRPYELDGKDYYFISPEEFRAKIAAHEFIEYQEVYENQYYGTLRSEVERIWASGKAILFDIDVMGAVNIKKRYKDNCLTVFVKPPSFEVLVERLKNRQTETEASLKKRIMRIKRELAFETDFDTVVINDLLEVAKKESEYLVENFILGKPFIEE